MSLLIVGYDVSYANPTETGIIRSANQVAPGSRAATCVLCAPFTSLPGDLHARAMRSLLGLPEEVGHVSFRELAPVIGQLRARHDLNILGMEVLAAAVYLPADVYLSAPSPRLEESLRRESRWVQILA